MCFFHWHTNNTCVCWGGGRVGGEGGGLHLDTVVNSCGERRPPSCGVSLIVIKQTPHDRGRRSLTT